MTKALLIHPYLYTEKFTLMRQPTDKMAELISLSEAIQLEVLDTSILKISEIKPATYIGLGAVQTIQEQVQKLKIDLVVVNAPITPIQQRNLEKRWHTKVIDRTGLILEIFGDRANTNEGRLQVELASLTYQRSRLVRSWTHLERQRGGHGFLGGPGELQIELDRRILDKRIESLKKGLSKVKKTRTLQRKGRQKNQFTQVALVGYTNAGKSTLFNALTGEDIFAKDLLFATLDPTIRSIKEKNKQNWVISDTVGFISDLPTELVAAFRATLEEVCEADILFHVHDVSHAEWKEQAEDVSAILASLFEGKDAPLVLNVYNKVDQLDPEAQAALKMRIKGDEKSIAISAKEKVNLDQLLEKADYFLTQNNSVFEITLDSCHGKAAAWLHENGQIIDEKYEDTHIFLRVKLDARAENRFKKMWHNSVVAMRGCGEIGRHTRFRF